MTKHDLPPPLDAAALARLAAEKREALAREVYDTGRIKFAITKAAADGLGMLLTLPPEMPPI